MLFGLYYAVYLIVSCLCYLPDTLYSIHGKLATNWFCILEQLPHLNKIELSSHMMLRAAKVLNQESNFFKLFSDMGGIFFS